MTKFQFHVLLSIGFLHLTQDANGVMFYVFYILFGIFILFALLDTYKEEQKKHFAPRH